MPYIDLNRYERKSLDVHEKEFLRNLTSFARLAREQIVEKAELKGTSVGVGVCPSILMAECIIKSNWGTLPPAKKENNLFLLEIDEYFRSKPITYLGKQYKTYDSWLDFFAEVSDLYGLDESYSSVLAAKRVDQQLDMLVELNLQPKEFYVSIEDIIKRYGLFEFD